MAAPWTRLGIPRATFIAVVVILVVFGTFAIVEARLLTGSTPTTTIGRPDPDPVVMEMERPGARAQQQWVFSVERGDFGTYQVDAWVDYLITVTQAGGSGELHGTVIWRTDGREVTRSDLTHAMEVGGANRHRIHPQDATHVVGERGTRVFVDVFWNLTVDQPGDTQVSLEAIDGRYELHSPRGVACEQMRCAVMLGVIGILVAAVPILLPWALRERPPSE